MATKGLTFVNATNANFRVYNPTTGGFAEFVGGRLDLDDDDPNFEVVKAEAERNPLVTILVNETTCPYDGEVFSGKAAAAQLAAHTQRQHPEVWAAKKDLEHAEMKARALKITDGFPCDVCQPVQVFGTKDDLAQHIADLHTQPPALDDEGNTIGGSEGETRRPGERAIPAARASSRSA